MAIAASARFPAAAMAPEGQSEEMIDTVSYAIGMAQTQGLREYLANRLV